jgi:hypothetical protein
VTFFAAELADVGTGANVATVAGTETPGAGVDVARPDLVELVNKAGAVGTVVNGDDVVDDRVGVEGAGPAGVVAVTGEEVGTGASVVTVEGPDPAESADDWAGVVAAEVTSGVDVGTRASVVTVAGTDTAGVRIDAAEVVD